MRILLKFPTRSRPQKALKTVQNYIRMANRPDQMGMAVSCDADDTSMLKIEAAMREAGRKFAWFGIFFGNNDSKIAACNADMDKVDYPWDIVVLVSDDMVPIMRGYDDTLRNHMVSRFPDTNGILWFNDGHQGDKLNTLSIYGRRMYESFGYLYHPAYKSLFCDTEITDLCRTTLKDRCLYVPYTIIRHEHPGTGFSEQMDALYMRNQRFWTQDMMTYITRKNYSFDWSVLIPTIAGREASLQRLISSLHEKKNRLVPQLRMEVKVDYDNREASIGEKRQRLLQSAAGKYVSFVDDDDEITDAYIEDLWATLQGGYDVMRLRGQIQECTFTHSTENSVKDPMAKEGVFVRPPNHLNPMLTDIAKLIHFQKATRGEDLDWTLRMAATGFLKKEYRSDSSRIHYIYHCVHDAESIRKSLQGQASTTYESMLQSVFQPVKTPQESGGLRWSPRGFVSR